MEPKMPPSTPISESSYPTCQETTVTKVSERNLYDDLELKARQVQTNVNYNSTQLGKTQEDAHDTDTRKARAWWLQRTATLICSERHPEAEQAYRDYARSNGLHEELARAILIHDISASTAPVQEGLAQYLVLLFLNLEKDHSSSDTHNCLESDKDMLLESLQLSLPISIHPKRTKREEAQITSLVRALLELSGGRVDLRQHGFAEEYTASENADLYASVFDIARTKQFGDFDSEEMCNTLSKSPVFSRMAISAQHLEQRTMKMMDCLRLGFPKGYLNLPSQVLSGFGVGEVDAYNVYLAHTYHTIPPLQKPGNNVLLLLTWSTMVSRRQFEVLREWASSEDGWNLYEQLARDVHGSQSVEQLALIMAALMTYRRLLPDFSDDSDQPIEGSYIADLDALLHGHSLGNSGRVAERMVFALVRVLRSLAYQFEGLLAFLEIVLDREPPLLHVLDRFSDQYLGWRIDSRTHDPAFKSAIAELSHFKMLEPRGDDDSDWVTVTHPEELSLQELYVQDHSQRPYSDYTLPAMEAEGSMEQSQGDDPNTFEVSTTSGNTEDMTPSHMVAVSSSGVEGHLSPPPDLRADQYALIRLSKVEDRNLLETLDTKIGTVNEVPNIEELSDESWEICILKSHRRTVQDTLGKIFSSSDVELCYDPLEPTANDLEFWDYDTAKQLRRRWFFQRAIRVVEKGWPAAAAYYAYLLEVMFGLSSHPPLVPTYRGYLQSKEDAVYTIEACLRGRLVHSCRGPQDGEATISGNVFVWEANSTGIDRWRDGMEWTVREEDGFEVGEAIDGSGLMKKTVSIPACRSIHHVVSYYTARDARTLARPPRSMTLRPELAVEANSGDGHLQQAQVLKEIYA